VVNDCGKSNKLSSIYGGHSFNLIAKDLLCDKPPKNIFVGGYLYFSINEALYDLLSNGILSFSGMT
jgi:hypothetical protein